jgi:hypothetical protein
LGGIGKGRLAELSRGGQKRNWRRLECGAVWWKASEGQAVEGRRSRFRSDRVLEIVEDHRGDTYRTVYTVKFSQAVYVLHAFQKKSPRGIKTAPGERGLVSRRLKSAGDDYEARYGKRKK